MGVFGVAAELFQVAVVIAIAASLARYWWKRRRAAEWPMTQGTVEQHVMSDGLDEYPIHRGVIWYSYQVNGEFYSGSYHLPESETNAQKLFARFPQGLKVPVRYDPREPETSLLDVKEAARNAQALSG